MTATVIHIDVYRAVWRTCSLSCKSCGYVWEGLVRDGIAVREITCPKCHLKTAKLLAAGELEMLPRHMRKDCR